MEDEALTPADELIIRRCAFYAGKHLSPGLTRDDLKQEGRLALLLARRGDRVPSDPVHREKYVARRVLGAMLDANTRAWRQQPLHVDELADSNDGPPVSVTTQQPDLICQMKQAIARVFRLGTPQMTTCMDLIASGSCESEAAAQLGVSPSRVSQIKRKARRIASHCW